jgi:delta11-fatty-acid desaturase
MLFHGVSQALNNTAFNRVVPFAQNKYVNSDYERIRLSFYFFVIHIIPFLLHGLTLKALLFSIIPIYLFSVCFMISSQINHLTPHTHEQFSNNFFIHQILTSHNVATDNYFVFLFTGGLNMQIEHHLFPSVNHCHLHKIQPHVRDLCKKYGIKYSESPSLWEALCQHVAHLRKFSH